MLLDVYSDSDHNYVTTPRPPLNAASEVHMSTSALAECSLWDVSLENIQCLWRSLDDNVTQKLHNPEQHEQLFKLGVQVHNEAWFSKWTMDFLHTVCRG